MIQEYINEFQRHYPNYKVEVKPKHSNNGEVRFAVLINGDSGGITLSDKDLREATRMFKQ